MITLTPTNPLEESKKTGTGSPIKLEETTPPPKKTASVQEPSQTLGERVASKTKERFDRVGKYANADQNDLSDPSQFLRATAQGVGDAAGLFADVAGEVLIEALHGMTPETWEDFLEQQIVSGVNAIADTEVVQNTLSLWQSIPEDMRDLIGAGVNTLAVAGPGMIPGISKGPIGEVVGESLEKSGFNSKKKALEPHMLDMTVPGQIARAKGIKDVFEEKLLNVVAGIKGMRAELSPAKMMSVLKAELARMGSKVNTILDEAKITIPKGEMHKRIFGGFAKFAQENTLYISKSMQPKTKKVFEALTAAIEQHAPKGSGMLTAKQLYDIRQTFDKNVNELFDAKLHEKDVSPRKLVQYVRNNLNDLAETTTDNPDYRATLKRVHYLLTAQDNLAYNSVRGKTLTEQVANFARAHPFAVASMTGLTSGGGASLFSQPLAVPAIAAGAAAYGLTRPSARELTGRALREAPLGPDRAGMFAGVEGVQNIRANEEQQ